MAFSANQFTRQSGGTVDYYTEATLTTLYVEKAFGGNINMITVTNDSMTDSLQVSFDGATLEGELKPNETKDFNVSSKTSVYVKGTAGGDKARIWGT